MQMSDHLDEMSLSGEKSGGRVTGIISDIKEDSGAEAAPMKRPPKAFSVQNIRSQPCEGLHLKCQCSLKLWSDVYCTCL